MNSVQRSGIKCSQMKQLEQPVHFDRIKQKVNFLLVLTFKFCGLLLYLRSSLFSATLPMSSGFIETKNFLIRAKISFQFLEKLSLLSIGLFFRLFCLGLFFWTLIWFFGLFCTGLICIGLFCTDIFPSYRFTHERGILSVFYKKDRRTWISTFFTTLSLPLQIY